MDRYQYRLKVNAAESEIMESLPAEQWKKAVDAAEDRGLHATLERRLITSPDILKMLVNPAGYMRIGEIVICPWEVLAEADYIGS